jgi:hypothetical protein
MKIKIHVFNNRLLRKILEPNTKETRRDKRILHNDRLCLWCLRDIILVTVLRRR